MAYFVFSFLTAVAQVGIFRAFHFVSCFVLDRGGASRFFDEAFSVCSCLFVGNTCLFCVFLKEMAQFGICCVSPMFLPTQE